MAKAEKLTKEQQRQLEICAMRGKQYKMKRHPSVVGWVVAVTFHETSCERAVLEREKDGELKMVNVDITELEPLDATEAIPETSKPGGPDTPSAYRGR